MIFQNSLFAGIFAKDLKKANIVPIHKKIGEQIVSNYRPVFLLPTCSKVFEKLIFVELFAFFEKRNLLSKHQSGIRPFNVKLSKSFSGSALCIFALL